MTEKSKTVFATALGILGLSQLQAAELLNVSHVTVKKWAQGASPVPVGVWDHLRALSTEIDQKAATAVDLYRENAADYPNKEMAVDINTVGKGPKELAIIAKTVLSLPEGTHIIENGRTSRAAKLANDFNTLT